MLINKQKTERYLRYYCRNKRYSFEELPLALYLSRSRLNNNNNTYIAPISILLFSSALKKKILRLHKVCMQKVHEPTKRSKTIMSTLKLQKNYLDYLNRKKTA